MPYLLLKWLHVLAAIVAVGANLTYGIWIARASRDADALPFTLRGIKLIDDRIASPAYGLLLVTGLSMVFTARLPLTTPWLLSGMVLFVLVVLVGMFGYTPALRRQIQLLDSEGVNSTDYQAAARRGTLVGGSAGHSGHRHCFSHGRETRVVDLKTDKKRQEPT